MVRNFQSSDKGKRVVTADGDMVGRVERVSGNEAHVKPDTGLSRSVRQKLGWSGEEESYTLRHSSIASISDDEIELKRNP